MKKLCSVCDNKFEVSSPATKYCSGECRNEALRDRQTSINTRWTSLQRILTAEKCDEHDPLWRFSTYAALIKSGTCVFCGSKIGGGIALDRFDNTKGHTAANCPPESNPVCAWCNRIRGANLTVAQMFRLKPLLTEFQKENKCKKK
jgi:hypothetical protein